MPSHRVKAGQVSILIYPWNHASGREYWRFDYHDPVSGAKKTITRATLPKAKAAAAEKAAAIQKGALELTKLEPATIRLIQDFLALSPTLQDLEFFREWKLRKKITVEEVTGRFLAMKRTEHGKETLYLRQMQLGFERFALAFKDKSPADLTTEDLTAYIEGISEHPKTRKEHRAWILAVWRYAQTHDLFPSSPAERIVNYRLPTKESVDILSIDEAKKLLSGVEDAVMPWLLFSMFTGCRSGEIRPNSKKPRLRWEDVKRDQGVIDMPAKVSKIGKRRLIPILPNFAAWLDWLNPPESGEICTLNDWRRYDAIGSLIGGWRKNVLRHSYGSYRAAVLQNLPALAIEMGNSVSMIEGHYREAVSSKVAKSFWDLTPVAVKRADLSPSDVY